VKIAIDFMHNAWNAVSQLMTVNCFRKAYFIQLPSEDDAGADVDSIDLEDIPLAMLMADEWTRLPVTL